MIGRNRRDHKSSKRTAKKKDQTSTSGSVDDENDSQDITQFQQQQPFAILAPQRRKKKQEAAAFSSQSPTGSSSHNLSPKSNFLPSSSPSWSSQNTSASHLASKGELPSHSQDQPHRSQQRHTSAPPSGPLYPSLEAVDGLSVRVLYPRIADDHDQSDNRSQLIGIHNTDTDGNAKPWKHVESLTTSTRAASDAMVTPSTFKTRTVTTVSVDNDRCNNNHQGSNKDSPGLKSPPVDTILNSSGISPPLVPQPTPGVGTNTQSSRPTGASSSVFGRPSNRGASLEDETPGPTQEQQKPQTSNSSMSTTGSGGSHQSKYGQMAAAVAAATSGTSLSSSSPLMGNVSAHSLMNATAPSTNNIGGPLENDGTSSFVGPRMMNTSVAETVASPLTSEQTQGSRTVVSREDAATTTCDEIQPDDDEVEQNSDDGDQDDDDDADSDDSELRLALLESSKIAERSGTCDSGGTHTNTNGDGADDAVSSADHSNSWSEERLESTRSNATTLRTVCEQDEVDTEVIDFCLQQCEQDQTTLSEVIQRQAATAVDEASLAELNDLLEMNETLLSVMEMAKEKKKQQSVRERPRQTTDGDDIVPDASGEGIPQETTLTEVASSMEIGKLVQKQDIFTLICMLRSQMVEQRLESALALLKFARGGHSDGNTKDDSRRNNMDTSICDEIHSSGGLHSLLTLFLKTTAESVKLVSALAVAHILPASVIAMASTSSSATAAHHSNIKPQVGLKIMECLRFLSTVREPEQNIQGEIITCRECWKAATMGLATFWIHALEPMVRTTSVPSNNKSSVKSGSVVQYSDIGAITPTSLAPRGSSSGSSSVTGGRQRHNRSQTWGAFNLRREQGTAGIQEILEMAVTLVIRFATREDAFMEVDAADLILLVEQVCGMEAARPIAVREGILRVLVEWMRSSDTDSKTDMRMQRTSVLSLRHLTSIKDKYMAGWIHSQMVSSGALPAIVSLTRDIHLSYPVQLAICQILASLCIAPHTRAAVVEADCIHFLIDLLSAFDYNVTTGDDELALFAGQALLQLATGAIQRAGSLDSGNDNELIGFAPRERHDRILNDIVARGAIASFVSIALEKRGKLRIVAIETLGVLSEDISPSRGTRLQLCEDGAASALGETLRDSLSRVQSQRTVGHAKQSNELQFDWNEVHKFAEEDLEQLYYALCALSNILDPTVEGTLIRATSNADPTESLRPRSLLTTSCLQTIESGGLKSMLQLAKFPLVDMRVVELVEEACHSLSLLSPFLLSKDIASKGLAGWAGQVLDVFCFIVENLEQESNSGESDDWFGENIDLHVSVLQGIGALAKSAPLKVRIIDRVLPYVIRAKNLRDHTYVSNSASQAFQSLEFADDEMAVQTAGNNANLLADWFCFQRSFLIQTMARAEIVQHLVERWGEAVAHANHNDPTGAATATNLTRMISGGSRSSNASSSAGSEIMLTQIGGSNDEISEKVVRSIIREYQDISGDITDSTNSRSGTQQDERESPDGSDSSSERGLLFQQVYPLNQSKCEASWILSHAKLMKDCSSQGHKTLSTHVEKLLDLCFPSRLLRERVIPTQMINLESSYNFRTILMPQRRYFSFRREGLLLSRLCDKELGATSDTSEVYWSLNFTNSSFAGEFPESLVQALYLCPSISALSFVGNSRKLDESDVKEGNSSDEKGSSMHGDAPPEGGGLLANLVGSLPPWVANVTFERVLDDQGMKALVAILETLGRLTAGQGLTRQSFTKKVLPGHRRSALSLDVQAQGRFSFFAVRHSPELSSVAWRNFFGLVGQTHPAARRHAEMRPLSSLRCLDISNNGLGDELCASVLEIIHCKTSGCQIEELDLSGNRIVEGKHVLKVLTGYTQKYRAHKLSGVKVRATPWQAPLRTLHLASNGLNRGKAWLEIVALLKNNTLELRVLDFSANKLFLNEDDYDSDILVSSLMKNTSLQCLNLSGNQFSPETVDDILEQLRHVSSDKGLAIIDLSKNSPPLIERQEIVLEGISRNSRNSVLHRLNAEKEAKKAEELELANLNEDESIDEAVEALLLQQESKADHLSSLTDSTVPVGNNKITVLFSAPLVFKDGSENLRPFAKLDFEMERELLWQCLKEASRDIELSFDSATYDRLLATISKRCGCLHYSGHGNEHYLPFEDGKGGPNWFEVEDIRKLIGARQGDVPFRFVFVSACYSGLAGETFASAGVPHVVCCRQEFELKDAAALAFTRQFYLALADGHTVKESFELGCKAVRATPNLRDAEKEMEKFILLPKGGNHDVPVFDAKPVPQWPRSLNTGGGISSRALLSKSKMADRNARSVELDVRNMIQEDPSPSPPQFFLGREVDMYIVLNLLLVKRLVSVIGDVGVGRSSLVCALCHYVNERKTTMNHVKRIFYVKAKQGRAKQHRVRSLVQRLVKKLVESETISSEDLGKDADIESLFDRICKGLKNEHALIVFDRTELLEDDEANEFPMFLSNLFRETRNVRVLLTAKETLGIPSIGGHVEHYYRLGPLTYANSVRLFSSLCPYMHTPSDRRRLYTKMVANMEEAELLPTDPGISRSVRTKFDLIGNGIPSNIEKAAYTISKENFMSLFRSEGQEDNEQQREHTQTGFENLDEEEQREHLQIGFETLE